MKAVLGFAVTVAAIAAGILVAGMVGGRKGA